MRTRRNIILAPHVDDETIGCFSLLDSGLISEVVYFYDLTDERWDEAQRAGDLFGFEVTNGDWRSGSSAWMNDILPEDTIIVPTVTDAHPDHKSVNLQGRRIAKNTGCKLLFYSIDMNVPYRQKTKYWEEKRQVLDYLYPSQRQLLSDEKYHLFEAITDDETLKEISISTDVYSAPYMSLTIRGYRVPSKLEREDLVKLNCLNDAIVKYWSPSSTTEIVFSHNGKTEIYRG